ncbi:hypothetical protein H696_03915 [Fonticula alba]|uniref:Uncharacterized protein n=1 Tax=Fonticula alba TaxID=691883 RepID=A0A058Z7M2_FONAL|nr:hypothetical protein H696_03915 [Fonticula alba]KCV69492.1 hypothetical protein H696_03915 [Fonticula alba]|eukprot:XP_009496057.1 hypothetical protein H696_03915 [Fonticula alba]
MPRNPIAMSTVASHVLRVLNEQGPMTVRQLAEVLPMHSFKSLTYLKRDVLQRMERGHSVEKRVSRTVNGSREWVYHPLRKFDPDYVAFVKRTTESPASLAERFSKFSK